VGKLAAHIIGYIKNVYQSCKCWTANHKSPIEKTIEEDFWQQEWRKAYDPIKRP